MKKPVLLFIILLLPVVVYLIFSSGKQGMPHVPIYYPEGVKSIIVDGKERVDTIYHTIAHFKFVDQNNDTVSSNSFDGKIYITNFFFATCPSICPKMMNQMQRVAKANAGKDDFAIISHTVNPGHDSVPVLHDYAEKIHADSKQWKLVTGSKKDIYDLAMDSYKLAVAEDPRAPGGFLHSELFVLIDKSKRVRGYYDGTDSVQVDKLLDDIQILRRGYSLNRKKDEIIQKH